MNKATHDRVANCGLRIHRNVGAGTWDVKPILIPISQTVIFKANLD